MIERDNNITQKYSSLRTIYSKKNLESNYLKTVGLTLEDAKSTVDYKTALIQLGVLIRTETKKDEGLEFIALNLYDSIQKVIKKRGSKIPIPYEDPRYLGPEYIKDRIKELKPKKQKKKHKEKIKKPIPLPELYTSSSYPMEKIEESTPDIQNNHPKEKIEEPTPDIQNNHPKDSQASSSDEESDAQNDGETASSNSHEQK